MIMLRGRNNSIRAETIEEMKSKEAPRFEEGKLLRCKPIRHMIPRTNFYYSNREWFKDTYEKPKKEKEQSIRQPTPPRNPSAKSSTSTLSASSLGSDSTRFTTPKAKSPKPSRAERKAKKQVRIDNDEITNMTDFNSEEYKMYKIEAEIPTKVYADSYIRTDAAKWKSTPVPGFRTCTYYDQYRRQTLKHYDNVYDRNRGVVPKYGGYVPGLKFRYGSTFGQLTHNAREIGVERNLSRTWGGAVSLF